MSDYTEHDLREALRAITSTIGKCEKALEKLEVQDKGVSQRTLLKNRIKAFHIAADLIKREIGESTYGGIL